MISYVGIIIVCRAQQALKAESDITNREVGRKTLTKAKLSITKQNKKTIVTYHTLLFPN